MPQKKTRQCQAFLLFLGLLAAGCNSTTTPANTSGATTITIPSGAAGRGSAAYGANPLHIAVGGKVVWVNGDSMQHTATSDNSVWDTGGISPGASSSVTTFSAAGTYPYHCSIHNASSMSGTIVVP